MRVAQAAQEMRNERDEKSTGQHAGGRAHAAQHRHEQKCEGLAESEAVDADEAGEVRKERAGNTSQQSTQCKYRGTHAAQADAQTDRSLAGVSTRPKE